MLPHQQRVVDEKARLDSDIAKLSIFVKGETYQSLDVNEQVRLSRQLTLMNGLSGVLGERIAAFAK